MSAVRGIFRKTLKDNIVFRIIFMIECCVLFAMMINCLRARCDYSFTCDNLYTPSGLGDWITDENGTGYQAASSEALGDNILVNTDFFALYPGSYCVKVVYTSQVSYLEESDSTVGTGYLNLNGSHEGIYYRFDSMLLRDGLNSVEQTLQVTSPWKISDFQMTLSYSGQGSLTVYSIEITENVLYKCLILAGVFLFFILLDIFIYLMFMGSGYPYIKELGVLTLICTAACLPFLTDWIFVGEDSTFWAAQIRLLAEELFGGNDFSAVRSMLTDSNGYTAASTYGSLFLFLPALLFRCGFSLTFVYNFYICIVSVATCLVTYYCALLIFEKSNPALLASALYTLSAPRLTSILSLASLGEMTAMTFFPLVLLGFHQIYSAPQGEKISFVRYVPAVIGLIGVFNSCVPIFWMTCLLILICCVIMIKKTVQLSRIAALAKAAACTGLFNLLSVILGLTSAGKSLPEGSIAWENGAYLLQIFNAVVSNDQPGYYETGDAAGAVSKSIGFSVTFGLILFLVYLIKKRWKGGSQTQKSAGFASLCWGMALFTIALSSVYLFYDYLDFLPGQFLSGLSGRLAPSGWLPFVVLFGIFCTCEIADSTELRDIFQGVPVILLLCMVLTLNTGQIYSDQMQTSSMERLSDNLYEYINLQQ